MYSRAANTYKRVFVESASPGKLLDELFARAIDDCRVARERMAARDLGGKGSAIGHALAIVGELAATLNFVAAPEMCQNLIALYDFVADRLMDANQRIDPAPLAEAARILGTLREAFQGAAAAQP
jgi:flagellar secretion chaperone FliS